MVDVSDYRDVSRAPAMPAYGGASAIEEEAGPVVLAVDGGGSKTDFVAIALDGTLVSHARGRGSNAQGSGWGVVGPILDDLRQRVLRDIHDRPILTTHAYLAGLDFPEEHEAAAAALQHWEEDGGAPDVLENDLFALLRAGTLSPDAAAVICGTGINALAVRADEKSARFLAVGTASGDWGGGTDLGRSALWHAARAEDGRGPATLLATMVPEALGMESVREVAEAVHFGRLDRSVYGGLCPVLFDAAERADAVAISVVRRQAEEIALLASVALNRLGLQNEAVPVVLGGGVMSRRSPVLVHEVTSGLSFKVPKAIPLWVTDPPILGAGLAALESVGAGTAALERFRESVRSHAFAAVPTVG